ncbi:cob(I)yrinic acid a,c-diamide adenosyltransferase [Acetobacter oeni]|uniref:Corrinoid adenosyltransferase n=1 Tax=Acetobacter oeni TaxID=304077 RepID=A0A511XGU5_9PROT|nr:cob(I)yrinic acid a,c-diamide adenosyltransferase [Acetobacter oeni]MBB3882312.1 cob(I)alamin adenosyltransferase [Acetobacter oeni]NHO18583.1 cob(I)yrinic acid a,c-diamide adenosyltransferase [Acetobacter oeni]GBR02188.1 cobalamin adenosyltransferase [Acetobacter oeni LMG 21952]GEN62174.1 cob(I)yrinic acid a,c-diamide adenosyltransferase [Acetobacter oeni]
MVVRIDRVVTRGGDKGQTSLGDGSRISKSSRHIDAIGMLDEVNAVVGLLRAHVADTAPDLPAHLASIQNLLFDIGGDLCQPEGSKHAKRLDGSIATAIEAEVERLRASQLPLTSFVLPGGSIPAAWAHLARTTIRRAERSVVALTGETSINPALIPILNRLSDYFFVLSRHLNENGKKDILWQPGKPLFT